MSAISRTRSNGVSPNGPSQVSVSRMYSTCVSECFVPLMNVTADTIGQSPYSRTMSSAPSPLRTGTTVACSNSPASVSRAGRKPAAFVATIATSGAGSSDGAVRRDHARVDRRPVGAGHA